ncbi:MAG TPA: BON domain-containing protein [Pseudonocardiaceae bacterium]|nr:BON domain-containing protein [Pseudonocardiaceae bacterium]
MAISAIDRIGESLVELSHIMHAYEALAGCDLVHDHTVLPSSVERTDADIAAEASRALASDALVPAHRIQVTGSRGVITLQGEVT